jgi:hypothetical protein
MISPLGSDINVQMCRIVSADITNIFKIFNVTEMNKLRRIFEAAGEIPDDSVRIIKRNKKTSLVVCNISPEPALSKRVLFVFVGKVLLCARYKKNIVYFSKVTGKIKKSVGFVYCWRHPSSSSSCVAWCREFSACRLRDHGRYYAWLNEPRNFRTSRYRARGGMSQRANGTRPRLGSEVGGRRDPEAALLVAAGVNNRQPVRGVVIAGSRGMDTRWTQHRDVIDFTSFSHSLRCCDGQSGGANRPTIIAARTTPPYGIAECVGRTRVWGRLTA